MHARCKVRRMSFRYSLAASRDVLVRHRIPENPKKPNPHEKKKSIFPISQIYYKTKKQNKHTNSSNEIQHIQIHGCRGYSLHVVASRSRSKRRGRPVY